MSSPVRLRGEVGERRRARQARYFAGYIRADAQYVKFENPETGVCGIRVETEEEYQARKAKEAEASK